MTIEVDEQVRRRFSVQRMVDEHVALYRTLKPGRRLQAAL